MNGIIKTDRIITYGKSYTIRTISTLFDEAEKRINSFGMANKEEALESREIFNSIINSIDISNKQLWTELQTIISLSMQQQSFRSSYNCEIRLTSSNQEKYDILERKFTQRYGKDIEPSTWLFNALLLLFNNHVAGNNE